MTVGPAWAEKEASSENERTRRAAPPHPERARVPYSQSFPPGRPTSAFRKYRATSGFNRWESQAAT